AWSTGLMTAFGLTASVAVLALALGFVALRRQQSTGTELSALAALVGTGIALAASGHASTAGPEFVTRPAVFVHVVSVAFWIGSLLPLFVLVRGSPDGAASLRRFSRTIPYALVLLAASGLVLAYVQLDRFDALWTTDYGSVLVRKLVLVGV